MPTPSKPVPGPSDKSRRRPSGSAKARRSAARLAAVQVLYQVDLTGAPAPNALNEYVKHRVGEEIDGDVLVTPDTELLAAIVNGTMARLTDIDRMLSGSLHGHALERLELLLRATLRAGAYEILAHQDVHPRIIINDYVNVTHAFFAGREPAMVNGVLDRIAHVLRPDEMVPGAAAPGGAGGGAE
ncbi:MAG TPA: transcription antitermination factor NusB [Azospirillaceae bacterium]|nr:transcription antitermination factor NusB [Azospirillaceae bacterium]